MSGGPSSSTRRPRASVESRDILRATQTFSETYPNIKTNNDLKDTDYLGLLKPLRKKSGDIPTYAKTFYKNMQEVEKALRDVAVKSYSYEKGKMNAKRPADKAIFINFESKVSDLQMVFGVGNPKLDIIFNALTLSELNSNLADSNLIHPQIAANPEFKRRARRVFNFLQAQRRKNASQLQQSTIDDYLNDIFNLASDETLDNKIDKSSIIPGTLLPHDSKTRAMVDKGHGEYLTYRKTLEKRIKTIELINKEKETIFSKPLKYARSAEGWFATTVQKFRNNLEGSTGGQKMAVYGGGLLLLAYIANSNNEEIAKIRDIGKKAGLFGLAYLVGNAATKGLTGKKMSTWFGGYIDDKSGKRKLFRERFNTDKYGAENLGNSIAYMGDYDFAYVANMYMQQKERYDLHPVPDNMKELPLGGVAENEMSKNAMYTVMRDVDRTLKSQGSSVSDMLRAIEESRDEASNKSGKFKNKKPFKEPSYAAILSGIIMDKELTYRFSKDGKYESVFAREVKTEWSDRDQDQTKDWWMDTGKPEDWREKAFVVGAFPRPKKRLKHLNAISKNIMPYDRPLLNYITEQRFGRYTENFRKLYEFKYNRNPRKKFHYYENTRENALYMTSMVTLDATMFPSQNMAKVAAVQNGYRQGISELQKKYKNHPVLGPLRHRFHEFAQLVQGNFLAPSKKLPFGFPGATAMKKPLRWVGYFRLALPASLEHKLTKAGESSGDQRSRMKETPMLSGDRLTRSDFVTLANVKKAKRSVKYGRVKIKEDVMPFAGTYETFLSNFGLRKDQKNEIDKVLEYYSLKFINSGNTKKALIAYLASHKFTAKEKRAALKVATGVLPVMKLRFDIVDAVRIRTYATVQAQSQHTKIPNKERLKGELTGNLGMVLVLACYGDLDAQNALMKIDTRLYGRFARLFNIHPTTGRIRNRNVTRAQFNTSVLSEYERVVLNMVIDGKIMKNNLKYVRKYQSMQ